MKGVKKITGILTSQHMRVNNKNNTDASCNINPVCALALHLKSIPPEKTAVNPKRAI
jgi:hypothetical protein